MKQKRKCMVKINLALCQLCEPLFHKFIFNYAPRSPMIKNEGDSMKCYITSEYILAVQRDHLHSYFLCWTLFWNEHIDHNSHSQIHCSQPQHISLALRSVLQTVYLKKQVSDLNEIIA